MPALSQSNTSFNFLPVSLCNLKDVNSKQHVCTRFSPKQRRHLAQLSLNMALPNGWRDRPQAPGPCLQPLWPFLWQAARGTEPTGYRT